MDTIQQAYRMLILQQGASEWPEFEIAGGRVALSPCGMRAVVCTEGRYPSLDEGFHLNERITETETLFFGQATVEWLAPLERRQLAAGDVLVLPPGRPYAVSGSCVSLITMDAAWDGRQKRLLAAPAVAAIGAGAPS